MEATKVGLSEIFSTAVLLGEKLMRKIELMVSSNHIS